MASGRVPGTTCVTQQQPIDFRTSQLAAAPPQGPVGADVYDSRFDANEIQSLEMFEASLKHRSLEELQYLRAKTEYLYEDAVRAYGAQSRAAAFAAASVAVVDNRITFLQSRSGKQKGRLQELIDAMHEGKAVKDAEVRKAIRDLLAAERNKPESDAPSGNESGSAMAVVVEAVKEVSRVKNRQFKELLERAKRPGAHVPDEHIKHELQKVLGVERQKQLLGIDDGNTMDLVAEAIDFSHTRRKSELRRLIDRANSGTHKPTREQVRAQIVKVLQTERERQLLGISDPDKDQSTDELINEARNAMSTVHVTIGPVTLERK
jgi:hypothetical protein